MVFRLSVPFSPISVLYSFRRVNAIDKLSLRSAAGHPSTDIVRRVTGAVRLHQDAHAFADEALGITLAKGPVELDHRAGALGFHAGVHMLAQALGWGARTDGIT